MFYLSAINEKLLKSIQQLSCKPKPNYEAIKDLLNQEFQARKDWIVALNQGKKKQSERQHEILSKYPCFLDFRHVSQHFFYMLLNPQNCQKLSNLRLGTFSPEILTATFFLAQTVLKSLKCSI